MESSFFQNLRQRFFTLRFSILSIFVSLFFFAIMILVIFDYVHSTSMLLRIGNKLLQEASIAFYWKFANELEHAKELNDLSADLMQRGIINTGKPVDFIPYTFALAEHFYIEQSAFWGDEKNNFVISEYEPDDTIKSTVMMREQTPATGFSIYRNLQGKPVKKVPLTQFDFFPTAQHWYQEAKEAKKTILTDLYLLEPSHELGITVAKPVYNNTGELRGVFGIDISLYWLSWYLSEQRITEHAKIFIVSSDGKLIAFPKLYKDRQAALVDIHDLSDRWIGKSFDLYKEDKETKFSFEYEGKSYLANYIPIPQLALHGWAVGVVVPTEDFTKELTLESFIDVGLGLFILAIAILLVSGLVTRVVNPIKKLVKETEKIKHFDLESKKRIRSHITEVASLGEAIHSMRSGLRSFQKYVPATLVRQLIESGEHARIGGSKKPLTIFFSDIENFTTIAEGMDPDLLMVFLCEYLEEMSQIILEEKGTIDKYIGDSIMAFWGAPFPVAEPAIAAARAAVRCMQRLQKLNQKWQDKQRPPLITRIGIHTGEVIVGNVGSTERINYTAIGDAINEASRLEQINKEYSTHVIVSDVVYELIKNEFILRFIDRVAVKGKVGSRDIYELLAFKMNELSFDLAAYREHFATAFGYYKNQEWDAAIHAFESCLSVYPEDTVALVFIKRCQTLKSNPPKKWDGVWRFETKF